MKSLSKRGLEMILQLASVKLPQTQPVLARQLQSVQLSKDLNITKPSFDQPLSIEWLFSFKPTNPLSNYSSESSVYLSMCTELRRHSYSSAEYNYECTQSLSRNRHDKNFLLSFLCQSWYSQITREQSTGFNFTQLRRIYY